MQQICLELSAPPATDQCFEGRLLIGSDDKLDTHGVLPVVFQPLGQVQAAYEAWVKAYQNCAQSTRLGAVGNQITNISSPAPQLIQNLRGKYQSFIECLRNWLNQARVNDLSHDSDTSSSCFGLSNFVFNPLGESRHLFVQTNTLDLWRYPWHEWLSLRRHRDLEVVFMPRFYHPLANPNRGHGKYGKIRALAILGQKDGLNLSGDLCLLKAIPELEVYCLDTPTPQEFIRLWQERWDILFYAGHSDNGVIDLHSPLALQQLYRTLQEAVNRGLQLAIFNSCRSIDIAQQLVQLGVPHVIAMREVIPDLVAQQFLRYFLSNFQQNENTDLYTAVAQARAQLRELIGIDTYLPGTAALPLICRHPQAQPLTWKHLQQAQQTNPTILQPITPSPSPELLFWCRLQLVLAQQELPARENKVFNYPTAQPLQEQLSYFWPRRVPPLREHYQQPLQNIVYWACGLPRTFGAFEKAPQLPFFFAALQLDAEATLQQVAPQRTHAYLQDVLQQQQGLQSTHAAILILQRQPNEVHLQQGLKAFEQALLPKKLDTQLKGAFIEQLRQFLSQAPSPLLELAWRSTQGGILKQYLHGLMGNSQEPPPLRLAAATVLGLAGDPYAAQSATLALSILRQSSSLEDVIAAGRCLHYLGVRQWEVEARLLRFLEWATVHGHQVALCRTLGLVQGGHPVAIETLERLIQQQVYDTDTLLTAVAALQRIAPEHPLPQQTLRTFVVNAKAKKDSMDFYQGLALMRSFHFPIASYLDAEVVRWMREEIDLMAARQEPYLQAPYTVLWYCTRNLPFGEIAKEFQ